MWLAGTYYPNSPNSAQGATFNLKPQNAVISGDRANKKRI